MAQRDEFSLIEDIRRRAVVSDRTLVGIGDDAALLSVTGTDGVLVTLDVLTEGVHFDLEVSRPQAVGRKALAVNLSDIAAMAGRPTAAVVGLVLPRDRGARLADSLMEGMFDIAAEFGVDLIGGDTNTCDGLLVVSVTLLGEPSERGVVKRSGARAGDWVLVTGALGGSFQGRHLTFQPRVQEALALHAAADLHAMIDLSDGLASDARHLARESGVGLIIDARAVPIHEDVDGSLTDEARLERALCDGEDFELLLTVSEEDGRRLLERPPIEIHLSQIGEVTGEPGCRIRRDGGRIEPLPTGGWVHGFD
ncbi:MAG: thiamine-monophosphate kinase [Planctomycetaceae bacterium]